MKDEKHNRSAKQPEGNGSPEANNLLLNEATEQNCSDVDLRSTQPTASRAITNAVNPCGHSVRLHERSDAIADLNDVQNDPELSKYWWQRYRLFSRFDRGIRIDRGNKKA